MLKVSHIYGSDINYLITQISTRFMCFQYLSFWFTVFHPPSKIIVLYSGNFGPFLKQRTNLKTCQQVESTRERVEVSTALFWKLKGVTLFVGKNAQIMRSMGKFLIENIVLGVPR